MHLSLVQTRLRINQRLFLERVFEVIFFFVALWLLAQCVFQNYFGFSEKTTKIIDWYVWFFLLLEVLILSEISLDKKEYFTKNWLTVAVLVVYFPLLLWFHSSVAIYLRFLRLLVWLRFAPALFRILKEVLLFNHIGLTLLTAVLLTILSGMFMSVVDPHINGVGNGMWWAWETITTVGYGDVAPKTLGGRLLAIVVMICGAALFSIITASLSAYIIKKNRKIHEAMAGQHHIVSTLEELKKKLEKIESKLNEKNNELR